MPLRLFLHAQGGIERAVGMILMSDGSAKKGKDAIAGGLSDVAVIAVDGVHHELESRVDDGASFFRVEVLNQIHRAFNVGEEGSNSFALTVREGTRFHRRLLGQDAIS